MTNPEKLALALFVAIILGLYIASWADERLPPINGIAAEIRK